MRPLALAALGSVALLVGGCGALCDRPTPPWVPGSIVVTFKPSVPTAAQAQAIIGSLGYTVGQMDPKPPIFATVTVPVGQECEAERRLLAHPDVNSALQDTYVSDR